MENPRVDVEREQRKGRIAGIVGLVGVALFVLAGALGLGEGFNSADNLYEQLEIFADEESEILTQLLIQAIAVLSFIAPIFVLFYAVDARSEKFRTGLFGLTIAGPLFFGASLVASWFAFDAASSAFIDANSQLTGDELETFAEDTVSDQSATAIASGLRFAGILGLVLISIYTSLNAMRAGLMTRFVGTLGMALGAGMLLLGLPAMLAFFLMISMLVAGFWPGARPPAWEAGVAVPWPKPGEEPEPMPEAPAQPDDFATSAREVTDQGDGENSAGEQPDRAPQPETKRKRKRKQRP